MFWAFFVFVGERRHTGHESTLGRSSRNRKFYIRGELRVLTQRREIAKSWLAILGWFEMVVLRIVFVWKCEVFLDGTTDRVRSGFLRQIEGRAMAVGDGLLSRIAGEG